MTLLPRLTAAVIASALDFRDEVAAEVAKLRGEDKESDAAHRYDPASVTDCGTERAHGSEPYSAEVAVGDIPATHDRFGFSR